MSTIEKYFENVNIIALGSALGTVLLTIVVLYLLNKIGMHWIKGHAKRTANRIDDYLVETLAATRVLLLFPIAILLGAEVYGLAEGSMRMISTVVVLALVIQVALWLNRLIVVWLKGYLKHKAEEDPASVTTLNVLGYIARLVLWVVATLTMLDQLGFNITTLLAGLGIGGVAVALAAQSILGDLFASLSIVFDKPFVIGDFIVIGDRMGTVEYVGLKTTRIRSLSGEQIILSNSELLKGSVHNYKRMNERRVVFRFGVIYQTPADVLEKIPVMVREIIEATHGTRFNRAHFHVFGASSLDFEVVYFVQGSDYNVYMDVHQAILLYLFRRFTDNKIEIAYPTQTIYLNTEAVA